MKGQSLNLFLSRSLGFTTLELSLSGHPRFPAQSACFYFQLSLAPWNITFCSDWLMRFF